MKQRLAIAALSIALGACATHAPRAWNIPAPLKAMPVNGYDMAYLEREACDYGRPYRSRRAAISWSAHCPTHLLEPRLGSTESHTWRPS